MKKQVLISLVLLITGTCYGQFDKIKLGVTGSFDYNSYLSVQDLGPLNYKGKYNFSGGITVKYNYNDKISIYTGITYSTKNWMSILQGRIYRPNPSQNYGDSLLVVENPIIYYYNSYLDVPLLFNTTIREKEKRSLKLTYGFVNSFRIGYNSRSDLRGVYYKQKSYHNYLFAFQTGLRYCIITSKLEFNIVPQMRFYIKQVHLNKFMNNPVHLGLELQIWRNIKS